MNSQAFRRPLLAASLLALAALSACTSIGYRCPLDPTDSAESPTACANMQDAMDGAKRGRGGRTSVFLDDKGRIVPREILENRAAVPLVGNSNEVYYPTSGQPAFQQPKVFQVWSGAYQDGEGNLHDGHHSWFTTPGRWTRGTLDSQGYVGDSLLRPAIPNERPQGRIVTVDRSGNATTTGAAPQPRQTAEQAAKASNDSAMKALSQAANSSANRPSSPAPAQSAAGVTAPAVQLAN